MPTPRIYSRRDIEHLIAAGGIIVINNGNVLRLNGWLDKHPGGRLVIQHMVGRDATTEISIYHSPSILRTMNKYSVGRISGTWINFTPPIRGGVFSPRAHNGLQSTPAPSPLPAETSSQYLSTEQPTLPFTTPPSPSSLPQKERSSSGPVASQELPRTPGNAEAVKQALDDDLDQYPSLDAQTQGAILQKYRVLHDRVKNEGYYNCHYINYAKEAVRYVCIFAAFLITLRAGWYKTSAVLLGLFWHQIMFTAHDAGHQGITRNFVADTLIGMFIADLCCGLSIGWWKSSHNVHHLVTNHHEHDPDIQNAPLFATSPSFLASFHSSYYDFTFAWDRAAELALPYQRYTYYPIMALARFNLYLLSWGHLLSPRSATLGAARWTRPTELAFMSLYWFLFGYCLVWRAIPTWPARVAFVLISHIVTMPLHVQITLSHWSMSTSYVGETESFPQHQLRTTMDVECPRWLDWVHGGLQFQAVHHLFPGVPRHNLRALQALVVGFAEESEIRYKRLGFVEGNKDVLGKLGEVGAQVEMMVRCQRYMAETGESGLH